VLSWYVVYCPMNDVTTVPDTIFLTFFVLQRDSQQLPNQKIFRLLSQPINIEAAFGGGLVD